MKYILILFISFILYSCASIVPPSGGDKDITPPKWIKGLSIPDSIHNTNFKSDEIVLLFNESIDIKNLQKELISNPDINNNLEYRIKKKRVHFNFIEPLDSNTTYVMNFGNSIVDINESNPAKNVIVAFSTGEKIDSLELYGTVINHISQKKMDNISIGLYPKSDTLDIETQKPKYYTKSKANGNFHFNYIKNDRYIIRAFEDLNKNLLYDKYKEKIGFIDSTFDLNESITQVNLSLFQEKQDTIYIKSVKRKNDHIAILFSQGLKEYKITSDSAKIISQYEKESNTVKVFTKEKNPAFLVHAIDSLENSVDTLVNVTNFSPRAIQKIKMLNHKLSSDYQILNNKINTNITFLTPLESIIYDSIDIIHGTDSLNTPLDSLFFTDLKEDRLSINIQSKFNFKDSLQIIFKKGSITTIYGSKNKKENIYFIKKDPKKYGVLAGKIETNFDNYIFQVMLNNKIIEEHNNIIRFEFKNLIPGSYTFRIINDRNKNGIYDTGNLEKRIKPEEILYHSNTILLKANWEIIDLVISTKKTLK